MVTEPAICVPGRGAWGRAACEARDSVSEAATRALAEARGEVCVLRAQVQLHTRPLYTYTHNTGHGEPTHKPSSGSNPTKYTVADFRSSIYPDAECVCASTMQLEEAQMLAEEAKRRCDRAEEQGAADREGWQDR